MKSYVHMRLNEYHDPDTHHNTPTRAPRSFINSSDTVLLLAVNLSTKQGSASLWYVVARIWAHHFHPYQWAQSAFILRSLNTGRGEDMDSKTKLR